MFLRLGAFYEPHVKAHPRLVTGYSVAVRDFQRALLLHGRDLRCEFFVSSRLLPVARREIARSVGRGGIRASDVHLRPRRDAVFGRELGVDLWHDVVSTALAPFELRRRCGSYPVTISHHSLSTPGQLVSWFLPLLLGDVREHDSIICASTAARGAIANLLEATAEELARTHGLRVRYRGRLDLVHLGVDCQKFRPRDRRSARERLRIPQRAFVLLFVGRITPDNKADLLPLVRTFRDLVVANPRKQLVLLIAGAEAGRALQATKDYARELGVGHRVVTRTAVRHSRTPEFYAAADVFVSPIDSIQESFGLTPLEAMACGVPQVVSDWDGYRDTVRDGETGFLIPTRWARCDADLRGAALACGDSFLAQLWLAQTVVVDPEAFRAALQRLIDDEELRRSMSERSRARAREFGWDRVIARYRELWSELVARAAKDRVSARGGMPAPSYADAFAPYATSQLEDTTRVVISPSGRAVLDGREPLPWYDHHQEVLAQELLWSLLERAVARGERGTTIARLIGARDEARRHVLWLLKYAFLLVRPSRRA